MNNNQLNQLFANYIEKFEFINNKDNNESYKWTVVAKIQELFDLDTPDADFSVMLYEVWRTSENLVDSANQQPFYALVSYAKDDPAAIRELFRCLFEDDGGDLNLRQERIQAFIAGTERLKEKYAPGSWRYTNDQRSVMAYLFFHDPDQNYLYKSKQAHEFADCVEFYEDWDAGTSFKLDVYYQMCDELVAAMRANAPLIKTHLSRFEDTEETLYEDSSLHILAFDMIYSSQVYNLYSGISYDHPNTSEKRLYRERMDKATALQMAYEQIKSEYDEFQSIKDLILSHISAGTLISHKAFGPGTVENVDGQSISVYFQKLNVSKKFIFLPSLANGFLSLGTADDQLARQHAKLLLSENSLEHRLQLAADELEPYREYL